MDDIAKHLGISKKTIYQHFSDKDELVTILIEAKLSTQHCEIKDHMVQAENAVHEIFLSIENLNEQLNKMNPKLFYDLQKYHSKAWLIFRDFKEKSLGQSIAANLDRGIREGVYRDNFNKDILMEMRLAQVDLLFNHHDHYTKNKYTIGQVIVEITQHFLYGVCNDKGLAYIKHYTEQATLLQH